MNNWTDAELAVFQRLTNGGLSAKAIAVEASAEFRLPITKNVIIGLWNRGKVTQTDAQKDRYRNHGNGAKAARESRICEKRERREARKVARIERMPRLRTDPVPPPSVDDLMIPAEQRRSIWELTASTCRWPVGDPGQPDFFYCGGEVQAGSSYCAGHHHRSTNFVKSLPFRKRWPKYHLAEAAE
jgi:GcrA cell cycle regulator